MERDIRNIIDKWYKASTGDVVEPDEFFKFIAAWIAFNAVLNYLFSFDREHERMSDYEKITEYNELPGRKKQHQRLLENDSAYNQAVEFILEADIRDLRDPNYRRNRHDDYSLHNVLHFVRVVRNNLFHGGKSRTSWRDRNLVKNCLVIVQKLTKYELSFS